MGKKYKKRYGKIPVLEPLMIIIINFIAISLFSAYTVEKIVGICFYFSIWLIYIIFAYNPFTEKYLIKGNNICIKKFIKQKIIAIPENAVFFISYVQIGKLFVKKRFMVNIVADTVDNVLEKLDADDKVFQKDVNKLILSKGCIYDRWFIEGRLKNSFIYSFAYEQSETPRIFNKHKKTVVLPRSLKSKLTIEENGFNVVIYDGR